MAANAAARLGRVILAVSVCGLMAACSSVDPDLLARSNQMSVSTFATALTTPPDSPDTEFELVAPDQERTRLAALNTNSPPTTSGGTFGAEPSLRTSITPSAVTPAREPAFVTGDDPWEHLNRSVFQFNDAVDTYLLEPASRAYRHAVPSPIRTSFRNALTNLESPVTWANDVLQGEFGRAENTFARFVINSTIGVAGLHDPATEMGYPYHREDFGQTLALHGVPSGPYMVVPLLGPSTPRHIVGRVGDYFVHPLTWLLAGQPTEILLAESAAEGVIAREEALDTLEQVKLTSPDYYVAVRSFYRQNRNSEISNGELVAEGADAELEAILDDIDF